MIKDHPLSNKFLTGNLFFYIKDPRDKFALLDHPSFKTEDAEIIFSKYDQMVALIKDFKLETYRAWTSRVDDDCQFNLSKERFIKLFRIGIFDFFTLIYILNFNKK